MSQLTSRRKAYLLAQSLIHPQIMSNPCFPSSSWPHFPFDRDFGWYHSPLATSYRLPYESGRLVQKAVHLWSGELDHGYDRRDYCRTCDIGGD